jgi:hypothetical protein
VGPPLYPIWCVVWLIWGGGNLGVVTSYVTWGLGYILHPGSLEHANELGRRPVGAVRDLCTPRSLQRWYEPWPGEGLSPSHDLSKILEVRCGDRREQFGTFWWIGAENGAISDGSE